MKKLWLARIYARRGYVVLADRLYESMQPPPPKFDDEVALNQADAHLLNKDWEGGARVLRRYLALDPKNLRGARDAGLGARRPTAISTASWRCAGAWPTTTRPPRTSATTGGRWSAPPATAPPAMQYARRDRRRRRAPTPRWSRRYSRMRYRATPELAGGGSGPLRSAGLGLAACRPAPRCRSGRATRPALLAWHDSSTDWSANQVVGPNVLRETRLGHRARALRDVRAPLGRVAAARAPTPASRPPAARTPPGTSSMVRPGSSPSAARASSTCRSRATRRSTCTST